MGTPKLLLFHKFQDRYDPEVIGDERTQYIFHLTNGLQFALDGITGWENTGETYTFFDDKGVAVVISKRNMDFFMPKPEKAEITPDPEKVIEAHMAQSPVTDEAKNKVLEEGKREAGRFVLKTGKGWTRIYDNESGVEWTFTEISGADLMFAQMLVDLANEAHQKRQLSGYQKDLEESEAIRISILDTGSGPCMHMPKEQFHKMLNGEFKSVLCPVVQRQNGEYLRIEDKDGEISFYPSEVKTKSDMQVKMEEKHD